MTVLRNGFWLLIPVFAITFGLWSRLPAAYGQKAFDQGVPRWVLACENVLRVVVFILPLFLVFGSAGQLEVAGWCVYGLGILVYLGAYLAQIFFPASSWSAGAIGFTAPAWTALFWLVGIGLVCSDTWLPIAMSRAIYLSVAVVFTAFHFAHAYLAFAWRRTPRYGDA